MNNIESATGEIVMYQPDETIRLEVRMGEETVWLTQQQMAELFQRDQSVIARHIRNIYKEEELDEEGTYAKFAYMGHDGLQMYEVNHYNLDVIISVGYWKIQSELTPRALLLPLIFRTLSPDNSI